MRPRSSERSRRLHGYSRSATCSAIRRANCPTGRSSEPRWLGRLLGDPDILLLDDPLRNVDAKLRYEMRLELPALLNAAGSTVLYVTQDFKEAMALGDRIAVLLDGEIAQFDTPACIYAEPASIGVARLFGDPTLNLIEVEPRLVDDAPEIIVAARQSGFRQPMPPPLAEATYSGCGRNRAPGRWTGAGDDCR